MTISGFWGSVAFGATLLTTFSVQAEGVQDAQNLSLQGEQPEIVFRYGRNSIDEVRLAKWEYVLNSSDVTNNSVFDQTVPEKCIFIEHDGVVKYRVGPKFITDDMAVTIAHMLADDASISGRTKRRADSSCPTN